jgi:hypothetical protein
MNTDEHRFCGPESALNLLLPVPLSVDAELLGRWPGSKAS